MSLQKIELSDAELYYSPKETFSIPSDIILQRLLDETPWEERDIEVYGKVYKQPRLIAWYGDDGMDYSYSGIQMTVNPWTELLSALKKEVEELCGVSFNSALLNYYRDGKDSIGFHSDNEKELGRNPTIASVSFGQTRKFIIKAKSFYSNDSKLTIGLTDSSVVVMGGTMQKYYLHGINKEPTVTNPRVNITFRTIKS